MADRDGRHLSFQECHRLFAAVRRSRNNTVLSRPTCEKSSPTPPSPSSFGLRPAAGFKPQQMKLDSPSLRPSRPPPTTEAAGRGVICVREALEVRGIIFILLSSLDNRNKETKGFHNNDSCCRLLKAARCFKPHHVCSVAPCRCVVSVLYTMNEHQPP